MAIATATTDPSIVMPVKSLPARPGGAERVTFSGSAVARARVDFDPDNKRPTVEFVLDLSGVTGAGDTSGTRFVVDTQEITVLPHQNNQSIDLVFPLPAGIDQPLNKVRTGLATFKLNVDLATGAISSGTATLTTR